MQQPLRRMLAEIIRHGRVDRAEQFFGLFVEIMRRHAHVIDDGALLVAVQQPDDAFLRIVRQQVLDLLGVGKPVVIVNISLHGFDVRGELVRIIHALRERDAVLRGLPDTLHRFDLRLDVIDRVAGGGAEEIGDAGDDRKHDKHAHDAQDISPAARIRVVVQHISSLPCVMHRLPPFRSLAAWSPVRMRDGGWAVSM